MDLPFSLAAQGLSKRFGPTVALAEVSVEIAPGECVALVGESGAGKTTLLRCFNRLVEPDAGRVLVDGRDARDYAPSDLRRAIGYVPQQGGLLPHWTVRRNVALVPWLRAHEDPEAEADRALARVGLDPDAFGGRWPRELSGGQRQRAALARAIAARTRLVLLDEPFGALDALSRAELQQTWLRLRRELPLTTVLVTHDLREAALLADRVAVLRSGRIEQIAPEPELLAHPATRYVHDLLSRAGLGAAP